MNEGKNISAYEEVEKFLSNLFGKLIVRCIMFLDDRDKNRGTLAELDITPNSRVEVIKSLNVEDYSEGPILDAINMLGDMWVFGKDVKGKEVYIKISLGKPNSNVICISFHTAEHPMNYPYKNIGK